MLDSQSQATAKLTSLAGPERVCFCFALPQPGGTPPTGLVEIVFAGELISRKEEPAFTAARQTDAQQRIVVPLMIHALPLPHRLAGR